MRAASAQPPRVTGRVFGVRTLCVQDLQDLARTCTVRGPTPGFRAHLVATLGQLRRGGHLFPLALFGAFADAQGQEVLQIALVGSWTPGCATHNHPAHYVVTSLCSAAEPASALSSEEVARLRAILVEVSETGPAQGGVMPQAS